MGKVGTAIEDLVEEKRIVFTQYFIYILRKNTTWSQPWPNILEHKLIQAPTTHDSQNTSFDLKLMSYNITADKYMNPKFA